MGVAAFEVSDRYGESVTVTEQVGDVATAQGSAERQVVRVVTPRTVTVSGLPAERADTLPPSILRKALPAQLRADRRGRPHGGHRTKPGPPEFRGWLRSGPR